jgi:hypothetical protein
MDRFRSTRPIAQAMKKFKTERDAGCRHALYVALDRDFTRKETSMSASSIQEWQGVLQDIAEQKRHRLTGSEYKEVIAAIEAQPRRCGQHSASVAVASWLSPRALNPSSFRDQGLNRVFNVEKLPAAPAGATNVCGNASSPVPLFSSHVNSIIRPSLQSSTGARPWPAVHGKRLDVFHNTEGGKSKFSVRYEPPRTFLTHRNPRQTSGW